MRRQVGTALRAAAGATILAVALMGSGCWDRHETNTMAIVAAMGVDRLDGGIVLTASIGPGESGSEGQGTSPKAAGPATPTIIGGAGKTIAEALEVIGRRAGRRPYLTHQDVLVVGRSLAEQGLDEIIDFYLRDIEARATMLVVVSTASAAEVLEAKTAMVPGTTPEPGELLLSQSPSAGVPAVELLDVVNMGLSDGGAAAVPMIEAVSDGMGGMVQQLSGAAVLVGTRLVGSFSQKETRGLSWISGKQAPLSLTILDESGAARAVLNVTQARRAIQAEVTNGEPRIVVSVTVSAILRELSQPQTFSDQSDLAAIEQAAALQLEDEIRSTVTAAQRLGADVFDFAGQFHRRFRKDWRGMAKRWPELFSRLQVEIRAQVDLRRTGAALRTASTR